MSWRNFLTSAPRTRGTSFVVLPWATRSYSLRSRKIQIIVHEHHQALEKDRDLILKVMGTLPSPREARQFLDRFSSPSIATATDPFVDKLLWPTDHLALIKLQGPFDSENLAAIAKTLVQLQRLGLMSVILLDNQTWWQNQGMLSSGLHDSEAEEQTAETKRRMTTDMMDIVEGIESSGGKACPVFEGVFEHMHHPPLYSTDRIVAQAAIEEISVHPGLEPIRSCLRLNQIPVMIPMATTAQCHRTPVQSNKAIVALAKYMGQTATDKNAASRTASGAGHGPLVPMRLIVINTTGGIPLTRANGIQGPTHCFVNIKDEYYTIIDDLDNMNHLPKQLAQSYRSDLDMIRESLEHLPPTCSGLITSSPSLTLITNLITDKPLFSSTMRGQDPKVMLATTVLRSGLDIFAFRGNLGGLDLKRLQGLLESSFGKPLDAEGFFTRIQDRTRTVVLAGQDYMGAAIVTREGGDVWGQGVEQRTLASVAYLDKFSIAPKSQGIGVADILWKKLTDEFPDLVF
ncbi:Amino-acid acetyltransferase, mitochondrial [Modicella reniformis]|uniref:Amino-acid acetyltransferase, mitochondrial n=1 Tax=Modicella reniformis TaxID=1440133 RepID=A0A9P6MJH3_9FUNG|nr:Amino-acid acetyltransferase, mitochondrial [Modicella reniformis]